jgi:hypothetical protein
MARVVAARGTAETLVHHPATLRTMRDRRIGASMIQVLTGDALLLWIHETLLTTSANATS